MTSEVLEQRDLGSDNDCQRRGLEDVEEGRTSSALYHGFTKTKEHGDD
jgi:hypothetical protein